MSGGRSSHTARDFCVCFRHAGGRNRRLPYSVLAAGKIVQTGRRSMTVGGGLMREGVVMGRSERPLGNGDAPVEIFAAELRELRKRAGNPTYLKMHRACGKIRSKTALSEAAGGDHLATWETVEAYVSALISINKDLEIDQAILRRKWEEAQDQRVRREWAVSPGAPESIAPATEDEVSPPRESRSGTLKLPG